MLVGSCLVFGSALGPLLAGLVVQSLGYRGLFALLAGVAGLATLLVFFLVPETLPVARRFPRSIALCQIRRRHVGQTGESPGMTEMFMRIRFNLRWQVILVVGPVSGVAGRFAVEHAGSHPVVRARKGNRSAVDRGKPPDGRGSRPLLDDYRRRHEPPQHWHRR